MIHNDSETACSKILMTADAVGGVWQYSVELAAALASRGLRVLLATMGPRPSAAQRTQLEGIEGIQLCESDFALEWMPAAEAEFERSSEWLLTVQRDFQADVVHLNGYAHAALDWNVPVVSVAHSCVFSWWRAVHNSKPGPDWAWYEGAVSAGLQRATALVAPTRAMANALASEYSIDASAVCVIPNSVSLPARASSHEKLPFCFAAGRFDDKAKNLPLLSEIASSLMWPVRLAGSVHAWAASGLDYLGCLSRADLIKKFAAASLFLHPAVYEPFGLSVLEAARSSCCLVLSDIPSLRELWDGCAQFADPRDPEEWVFEVNRLIRSCSERSKLAERACKRSHRYSADASVSAYVKLYRELRCELETRGQKELPAGAAA